MAELGPLVALGPILTGDPRPDGWTVVALKRMTLDGDSLAGLVDPADADINGF